MSSHQSLKGGAFEIQFRTPKAGVRRKTKEYHERPRDSNHKPHEIR